MASRWSIVFFIAIVAAASSTSEAQKVHVVGDALGWTVPPGGPSAYRTWASQQTFTQGDVLEFNYTTGFHDVAEVNKAAYDACNIRSPISSDSNGPSNVTLTTPGEHYYICTIGMHCALGMKLAINVSASTSTTPSSPTPATAPAPKAVPAPAPVTVPAPAPTATRTPRTYVVGDALGWTVPPGGSIVYQTWAANKAFLVGDILLFNFSNGNHDVAHLTSKADFDSCNISAVSNPIMTSPARITLTTSGEHLYICTFPRHCSLGQKLAINVTGTDAPTPSGSVANPPAGSGLAPSSPTPASGSVPPPPSSAPISLAAALPIT